jgi:very-short-patch-repair endonuclease
MLEHLIDAHGILLRRNALAAGSTDNALKRAVRAGFLVRLRQGVYVLRGIWEDADPVARHRLLLEGTRQLYDDNVAASHVSACIEQGGPNWGLDLTSVHFTSLYGKGERSAALVVHHRGELLVNDITRDERGWLTAPARTALDTATLADLEPAVAVLDWYVQAGLTTLTALFDLYDHRMRAWPDTLRLRHILGLADGRAESVGETRTRLMLRAARVPAPIAQYEIKHPSGLLAGRVDFAWPEFKVMLEFDGLVKYHRLRRPGETIEQMVIREKQREDTLRELTGWVMIRITWADLAHPEATVARILRAMRLAA